MPHKIWCYGTAPFLVSILGDHGGSTTPTSKNTKRYMNSCAIRPSLLILVFEGPTFSFAVNITIYPCHTFAIPTKDRKGQFDSAKVYEACPCRKLGVRSHYDLLLCVWTKGRFDCTRLS